MSRAEKPSPHSSPRLSRRSQTPSFGSLSSSVSQQSDIYTAQLPPSATATQQHHHHQLPSAPSMQSITGTQFTASSSVTTATANSFNGSSCNSNNNSSNSISSNKIPTATSSSGKSSASSASQPNRMSAPTGGSSGNSAPQPINKVLNKALSADLHDLHDQIAPPLPPRKSSPSLENAVNRQLKPQVAPEPPQHQQSSTTHVSSSLCNLSANGATAAALSRSSENITFCEFDVPKSVAPPIPKHNVVSPPLPIKMGHNNNNNHSTAIVSCSSIETAADELQILDLGVDDMDKVIVGPAETISGIIDTRPIEHRHPSATIMTSVSLDKDNGSHTTDNTNNVYHLKTNAQNHIRHQSFPNSNSASILPLSAVSGNGAVNVANLLNRPLPSKSATTPHFGVDGLGGTSVAAVTSSRRSDPNGSCNLSGGSSICGSVINPLLYENVTINNQDCNVPYENINLEYIARLMKEGYSKENVVSALGISRNNIEMACDILHEFVSKKGT